MNDSTHKNAFLPEDPSDYKHSLVNQMAELEALWSKLNYGQWNASDAKNMHQIVHHIRSSSAVFKHNELVEVAIRLEMQLLNFQGTTAPSFKARELMEQQLKALNISVKKVFNQLELIKTEEIDHPSEIQQDMSKRPKIYIVDHDPLQLKHLEQQLTPHNYHVTSFTSLAQLSQTFKQHPLPQAVITDIAFPQGDMAGIKVLSELNKQHEPKVPVIYVSSRTDLAIRLAAKRAGGISYLTKPVNIPSLLHKLDEISHDPNPFRVMIVDDDEIAANMHSLILQRHNIDTRVLTQVDHLMEELHQFDPELILMDYRLPGCTGVELMELIRGELRYASLPIYVISGEISKLHQEKILDAGADDFLVKPVKTKLLVSMVRNRIKRERSRTWGNHFSDNQDIITGLYNRNFFLQRLTHSLKSESSQYAAVLQIKIDRYIEISSLLGLEGSNQLLRNIGELIQEQLSPTDLLSRYNESSFTILGLREDRSDFITLGQHIRTVTESFSTAHLKHTLDISTSIGMGVCWGTSAQNLMNDIEQLTREASSEGGNTLALSPYFTSLLEGNETQSSHINQLSNNLKNETMRLKFQPIVSTYHDHSARYEVLLHFFDDEGVSIQTRPLLRLAEKKNIMHKIDLRIIKYASQALVAKQSNDQVTLFIKLSNASLLSKDLPLQVSKFIKLHKLSGDNFVFMLSTDNAWQYREQAKTLIQGLTALNCPVGLEYFGRKQSDTQLLDQLNISYVKFAPSLIRDIHTNEEKYTLLQQLILEVKQKRAESILGFIEDADIMNRAWMLNPDLMLGYFVQPPDNDMNFVFTSEAESTGFFEAMD